MLFNIILDIKYKIASFSSLTWYKLYLYDEEFRKYARTTAAINEFIQLFTLVERLCDGNEYARVQTSIFGLIHSFNDEPSVVFDNGKRIWYYGGCIYRGDDNFAIFREDGTRLWYNKYNTVNRDNDKPTVIHCSGAKIWYKDGLLHRENDLPALIRKDAKMWYQNGKKHRGNNKPAIIWNDGSEEWYRDGIRYFPQQ